MLIKEIKMPRLGVNDEKVTIGKWNVKSGQKVKEGQTLAVLESTKETSELKAEVDGFVEISQEEGKEVEVGSVIAKFYDEAIACTAELESEQEDKRTYTKKAKALLEEHPEIDVSKLPVSGIIKEQDIEKLISKPFSIEKTMSNKVLIYGVGGICKDAIDIINQTKMYQIEGIVDFNYPDSKEYYGIPIIGGPQDLEKLHDAGYNKLFSAVAFWENTLTKHYRKNPYARFKRAGYELINIVDRNANVSPSVEMGEGNMICANTFIGPNSVLGSDIIVNVGAVVNHDCIISDHCHIASGAILAGEVIVGENTLIGQGVVVLARVKIGKNVTINNGCRIFKDVPDGQTVAE